MTAGLSWDIDKGVCGGGYIGGEGAQHATVLTEQYGKGGHNDSWEEEESAKSTSSRADAAKAALYWKAQSEILISL
ncbi:hypothetical protein CDAR_36591 [Caerostris darwini]|uniref:Uncharacterized protein n=1 Tax=Caerostris darwini TaxID=1538125 RepID=A0AAV4UVP4_9ARAC|nr:hypothetical protein CDAR_36591 [Caerostris darwini]